MQTIHLQRVDSTNSYLKRLISEGAFADDNVLVWADEQFEGRGQRGNSWESEPGKNLSFSVLCHPRFVVPSRQFLLSQAMAVAVVTSLNNLKAQMPEAAAIGDFCVKWPNDIYHGDKKVGGTLIECDIAGKTLQNCVIGTGLNVNQRVFRSDAPNPSSLALIFGQEFSLPELLNRIIGTYWQLYELIHSGDEQSLQNRYLSMLYRKSGFHLYEDAEGRFMAEFHHIEPSGHLILKDSEGHLRRYEFKQVRFLIP